jgi:hypothetical protein
MNIAISSWKQTIFSQLHKHNRQLDSYAQIIDNCVYLSFTSANTWLIDMFTSSLFSLSLSLSFIYSIESDNQICETNTLLLSQCRQLEKDVRYSNSKNSILESSSTSKFVSYRKNERNEEIRKYLWIICFSEEFVLLSKKLKATNEELVTHLREKSEVSCIEKMLGEK